MAPYSIQNVAEIGLKDYGVYPGDWYGINTASLIFENLDTKYAPLKHFRICTFQDGNICLPRVQELGCQQSVTNSDAQDGYEVIQEELDLLGSGVGGSMSFDFEASRMHSEIQEQPATSKSEMAKPPAWTNHVLLIVSNRFGIERVSEEYFKVIKKYMKLSSFVGLVGGKPRFAYYFVGHLERPAENEKALARLYNELDGVIEKKEKDEADRLVFLDPHYVSP